MMNDQTLAKSDQDRRNHLVERIITGVVGAILLGLQGINISETGGNGELIRRVEQALHQQTEMVTAAKAEGGRVDRALENQAKMIERLDGMLQNEVRMLDILKAQQEQHK